MNQFEIAQGWWSALQPLLDMDAMQTLAAFLETQEAAGKTIYPKRADRFRALDLTPLDAVRVVILGQDPYHGPDQANGLCFSVAHGMRPPPSLRNIFKELESDLKIVPPSHGSLDHWASQGVLLLNTVLTVEMTKAGSHGKRGWEHLTDAIIRLVDARPDPVVFMLWGSHAQAKADYVDAKRHLVLKAPHPSPLSAHRGFLGCRHFSRCNAFLTAHGYPPIDWQLPSIAVRA